MSDGYSRKRKPWTDEAVAELKRLNDEGYHYKEIATLIGRSFCSVAQRMHQLGIKSKRMWTKEETEQLRELCDSGNYTFEEIAAIMGRTKASVQSQANNTQKISNTILFRRWEKIQALNRAIVHCGNVEGRKAAMKVFNLTEKEYAYRRKVVLDKNKDPEIRLNNPFSDEDYLFVMQNFGLRSHAWIGQNLRVKRTASSVRSLVHVMGITQWDFHGLSFEEVDLLLGGDVARNLESISIVRVHKFITVIPWVMIFMGYYRKPDKDPRVLALVSAMATFQCYIYGYDHPNQAYKVLERMRHGQGKGNLSGERT